jgi:hypothetical protein
MCPVLAAVGSSGRYISAVWVEVIVAPFGFVTCIGVLATWMLWTGVPMGKKCEVQPVSPMEAKVVLPLLLLWGGDLRTSDRRFVENWVQFYLSVVQ